MAKRTNLTDPFASTEPRAAQPAEDNSDLEDGRIVSSGVGMKQGELAAIDQLAQEYGVRRNALLRLAIRLFIVSVRSGKLQLDEYLEDEPQPRRRARMPK